MAEKTNVTGLIRDYLSKHSDKKPSEIAKLINQDHGLDVKPNFVSATKSNMKKDGAPKVPAKPKASKAPAKPKKPGPKPKKPSAPKAKAKRGRGRPPKATTAASTNSAPAASAKASGVAQHVSELKDAAQALGKDQAKKIIDLL